MRKQHEKELSTIEKVLDSVIKGDFPKNADSYQEGQESKLIFKTLRIAEANQLYQETAAREKQRVQELMVDAAHQMRTPITSMLMFTELLQNKQLPLSESQEFLRRLSFDSQRLNWLVEEFLHMSKFETESMELTKVRQNLSETIQQAILQSSGAEDEQKRFVVKDADVEITHDIKWTREAIGNVLENAIKYAYKRLTSRDIGRSSNFLYKNFNQKFLEKPFLKRNYLSFCKILSWISVSKYDRRFGSVFT